MGVDDSVQTLGFLKRAPGGRDQLICAQGEKLSEVISIHAMLTLLALLY